MRDNTSSTLIMDQNLGQHDSNKSKANVKLPIRETNNGKRSNKTLKHSEEKSNICNQCASRVPFTFAIFATFSCTIQIIVTYVINRLQIQSANSSCKKYISW